MTSRSRSGSRTARAVVLAVTAWVSVVALGSTLVWAVISRAGEGVVDGAVAAGSPEPTQTLTPVQPSAGAVGQAASRAPGRRPSTNAPSALSSSGPTTSAPTPTQPGTQQTKRPGSSPSSGPAPSATKLRTWNGKVGTVTAACTGQRIEYRSASPRAGYKLEWEYDGSTLRVKFESTGEQGGETEVRASCRSGAPEFHSVGNDGGDGGDDGGDSVDDSGDSADDSGDGADDSSTPTDSPR
jgi:hypothetical protein